MFTKADILARLQNGDTVDGIAAEMAAALNEAEAEKKALDAELEAKEKEEIRVLNAKRVAVDEMLDALCDYLVAAGEGDFIEDLKEIDTDKVIEMLDGSIEMAKSLEKLKDLQFPLADLKLPIVEHKCGSGDCDCDRPDPAKIGFRLGKIAGLTNADDIIKDFLKSI